MSDVHRSPPYPTTALFPAYVSRLPREEREAFFAIMRADGEMAYMRVLKAFAQERGPLLRISTGDLFQPDEAGGITDPRLLPIIEDTAAAFVALGIKVCFGNHDLGVRTARGGKEVNLEALELLIWLFGPPYWKQVRDGVLVLGICSSLFEYSGIDGNIRTMGRDQAAFIADSIAAHAGPWILCAHAPASALAVRRIAGNATKRMLAHFFGDIHNPAIYRAAKSAAYAIVGDGSRDDSALSVIVRGHSCPSTSPYWWRGYAYLRARVEGDRVVSEEVLLDKPSERSYSSALWCAYWLARGKIDRIMNGQEV